MPISKTRGHNISGWGTTLVGMIKHSSIKEASFMRSSMSHWRKEGEENFHSEKTWNLYNGKNESSSVKWIVRDFDTES